MRTSFDKSTGAKIFYNRLVPYRQIHEIERNLSLIKNDYSMFKRKQTILKEVIKYGNQDLKIHSYILMTYGSKH